MEDKYSFELVNIKEACLKLICHQPIRGIVSSLFFCDSTDTPEKLTEVPDEAFTGKEFYIGNI